MFGIFMSMLCVCPLPWVFWNVTFFHCFKKNLHCVKKPIYKKSKPVLKFILHEKKNILTTNKRLSFLKVILNSNFIILKLFKEKTTFHHFTLLFIFFRCCHLKSKVINKPNKVVRHRLRRKSSATTSWSI